MGKAISYPIYQCKAILKRHRSATKKEKSTNFFFNLADKKRSKTGYKERKRTSLRPEDGVFYERSKGKRRYC